jgi:hypothetical protein
MKFLWVAFLGNIAVAAFLWMREGTLVNETRTTMTVKHGMIQINGQDAPLEWIERGISNKWLWIAVLGIGIYSGRLLIQLGIKGRRRQLLAYFALVSAGTAFVWLRLPDWGSARWGGSFLHEWVGVPAEFLFVPSVFFWLDWRRTQPRSWLHAMARSIAEIVALVAWPYCWAVIQLMMGWLWI